MTGSPLYKALLGLGGAATAALRAARAGVLSVGRQLAAFARYVLRTLRRALEWLWYMYVRLEWSLCEFAAEMLLGLYGARMIVYLAAGGLILWLLELYWWFWIYLLALVAGIAFFWTSGQEWSREEAARHQRWRERIARGASITLRAIAFATSVWLLLSTADLRSTFEASDQANTFVEQVGDGPSTEVAEKALESGSEALRDVPALMCLRLDIKVDGRLFCDGRRLSPTLAHWGERTPTAIRQSSRSPSGRYILLSLCHLDWCNDHRLLDLQEGLALALDLGRYHSVALARWAPEETLVLIPNPHASWTELSLVQLPSGSALDLGATLLPSGGLYSVSLESIRFGKRDCDIVVSFVTADGEWHEAEPDGCSGSARVLRPRNSIHLEVAE